VRFPVFHKLISEIEQTNIYMTARSRSVRYNRHQQNHY